MAAAPRRSAWPPSRPWRSPGLALAASLAQAQASGPIHVVIDATGLKVCDAGEWLVEKHGERGTRTGRKLHLPVDPDTGEIFASELTNNEQGDASQVGPVPEQIPSPIASVTADGACDGEPVYRAVAECKPDPSAAVVIPPRSTAVPSEAAGTAPSQRDRHIRLTGGKRRMAWQKAAARGNGEVPLQAIIGSSLRARILSAQKTKAKLEFLQFRP